MIPDGFVPVAISECEVAGYRIPKGSELLVNVCGIARDPALWPDPLVFRPARFVPGGSHAYVDVKGGDFGLIPFGAGRRICAGLSWGLRMVTLASATLVHAFRWGAFFFFIFKKNKNFKNICPF